MTAASLTWRVILSHYLPGLLVAVVLLVYWASNPSTCSEQTCQVEALIRWAKYNATIASFLALVGPLLVGIVLDDIRHRIEDSWKWTDDHMEFLSELPDHLYRFMYDEYYYYVEFDGNSALALLFSTVLGRTLWGPTLNPAIFAALVLIFVFLAWSWHSSLDDFFHDLKITAEHRRGLQAKLGNQA
jgi:hypothetical protein